MGEGPRHLEKRIFFETKIANKNVATKTEGGGGKALVAGLLKNFFCGFPKRKRQYGPTTKKHIFY